ncbi:uncharacterized protein [Venturia canescens]|uniref:uncharacterized protein n=1 Tax=Venturia canescens TaxID=32260 RepID=UPI001C9C4F01|nr:uncharacterized protein LOC122408875 [Venturia canescens]
MGSRVLRLALLGFLFVQVALSAPYDSDDVTDEDLAKAREEFINYKTDRIKDFQNSLNLGSNKIKKAFIDLKSQLIHSKTDLGKTIVKGGLDLAAEKVAVGTQIMKSGGDISNAVVDGSFKVAKGLTKAGKAAIGVVGDVGTEVVKKKFNLANEGIKVASQGIQKVGEIKIQAVRNFNSSFLDGLGRNTTDLISKKFSTLLEEKDKFISETGRNAVMAVTSLLDSSSKEEPSSSSEPPRTLPPVDFSTEILLPTNRPSVPPIHNIFGVENYFPPSDPSYRDIVEDLPPL